MIIHVAITCAKFKVYMDDNNCGEWVECMDVASGSGCKEVYGFPHITYPYSSCFCSFLKQNSYFLFIFNYFFILVLVLCN